MSDSAETAILAGGCFWPAQEVLRHRDGVVSTRVGYTGGENDNPTDQNHADHAEAPSPTPRPQTSGPARS
jgi:peptide-methionine (S)-S-oxide reductase